MKYFCNYCKVENYENINKTPKKLSSAVIVGTARDIAKFLENSIKKLEMIAGLFEKHQIIIYENDSKDKTLNILNKWEKEKKDKYSIKIISEKNVPGLRTHRLSHGRNLLLNEALKFNYEYLIVVDLDDVIQELREDSFLSSFNYKDDWAVMCANQKGQYYDLWALRTLDNWLPFDCWNCDKIKKDRNFCVTSRYKNIPKQKELIEVTSCFGGLAIYKTKYIKNCKYYGGEGNNESCEHVNFNECIKYYNGGKLHINTNMINH